MPQLIRQLASMYGRCEWNSYELPAGQRKRTRTEQDERAKAKRVEKRRAKKR